MDRISQLPESILHHILSFLKTYPAELVRMSVLSKTWFHLTSSFPVLYFSIHNFKHVVSRQSFFKYVEYTTSRFCHQNLTAHTFKLVTTIQKPAELGIVNSCLLLVLRNGVKELVIDATNSSDVPKYRLPNTLLSVSVLKSLAIRGCDLPSSLMLDTTVEFKSLICLRLENVQIDDEVIKHLTTSCPLLQEFKFRLCQGFERFCIHGHQNLQRVSISFETPVERIDIEAPNLSDLVILDTYRTRTPWMNLASCKRLTTMTYIGYNLPNSNGFTDFLSNLPCLDHLVLVTTYECNNLRFSSHSLRTLVLHSSCDLENIEFNTPKLVSFSYTYSFSGLMSMKFNRPSPLLRDSTHLKACMHYYPNHHMNTLRFQKLRKFLDKKNGFKVFNLYIHDIPSQFQEFTEFEKLKAIELPSYELEHVELQLESNDDSLAHIAFVDAVLWCCRPRSVTLRSSLPLTALEEHSDVVKFTYEKLLGQEDEGRTNIQIVSPFSSLLMAIPHGGKAISFIKKEVLKEEAYIQGFADLEIV